MCRHKGFFNRAGRYPAHHVLHGACLIVGSGSTGTTKWLLPYYGAGWLVVNVEVTCRMAELIHGQVNGIPVLRQDGTGKGIRRGTVNQLKRFFEALRLVHINGYHRAENLFAHGSGTADLSKAVPLAQ